MNKTLLKSKTVWAAAFVAAIVAALGQFGITISAEQATMASLVVATFMRYITKDPIVGVVSAK